MRREFTYRVLPEDRDLSIRELLRRRLSFSSRMLTRLKKSDGVLLNGTPVKSFVIPMIGDIITAVLPLEESHFEPQPVPVRPVYEDDDLLVIDKPAGFVVHPTRGHPAYTMANGVAQYLLDTGQHFKVRFINRLDMDTSGLLIVAKNACSQEGIIRQMQDNKVEKTYLAVLQGLLTEDNGTIDLPIGKPDPEVPGYGVLPDGQPSITHFTVLERFAKGYTLVKLLLETGRTHQIRVHMSHTGHPVVGDHLYGGENVLLISRQALHSARLSFLHPVNQTRIVCEAPLPQDMQTLIEKLQK